MDTNILLDRDIYPRLSHDIVFKDLNPKERGAYYVMDCPFCGHKQEFFAYKDKPFGVCNKKNSCGKSLTWWNHIQEKENLTNQETLFRLAEMAGINIDKRERTIDPRKKAELDFCEAFLGIVQKLFPSWEDGRNYLLRIRKFPENSLKTLEFGYFQKDMVLKELKSKGFKESQIKESPINTSGYGTLYKMIIPWRDEYGKIKGFVGRCIGDPLGDAPKYKYSKGLDTSAPFNIQNAKIGKDIVIVEGILDALHLMAEGVKNVVALGRDSLTQAQMESLLRLKKTDFFLALDNDEAGRKGTEKTVEMLSSFEGVKVYIIHYSGSKDPDQFLRENGAESFKKSISNAQNGVLWIAERVLINFDVSKDTEYEKAIERAVEILEGIVDPVNRKKFKAKISRALGIPQEALESKAKALKDKKSQDHYDKRFRNTLFESYQMLKDVNLRGIKHFIGSEISKIKEEGLHKKVNGAREYLDFLKTSYRLLTIDRPNTLRLMIEEKIKEIQDGRNPSAR